MCWVWLRTVEGLIVNTIAIETHYLLKVKILGKMRPAKITIYRELEGQLLVYSVEKLLFLRFSDVPAETCLNQNNELHFLSLPKLIEFTKEPSFSTE